jgi:hypothetical protein
LVVTTKVGVADGLDDVIGVWIGAADGRGWEKHMAFLKVAVGDDGNVVGIDVDIGEGRNVGNTDESGVRRYVGFLVCISIGAADGQGVGKADGIPKGRSRSWLGCINQGPTSSWPR